MKNKIIFFAHIVFIAGYGLGTFISYKESVSWHVVIFFGAIISFILNMMVENIQDKRIVSISRHIFLGTICILIIYVGILLMSGPAPSEDMSKYFIHIND